MTRIGLLMVGVALIVCLLSGPARGAEARSASSSSSPLSPSPSPLASSLPSPVGTPAQLAFVTGTGAAPDQVSVLLGGEARVLGPGDEPLLSPSGEDVAASLFGAGSEHGPALAVYDVGGAAAATYLELSKFAVQPLAWSPDSRYLAFFARSTALHDTPARSALDVLDTVTRRIATLANGQIAGASFSPDGRDLLVFSKSRSELDYPADLYTARPGGGGLRRLTSDGRSLDPVWGTEGIAYDRERLRHDEAPAFQIWLRPKSSPSRPRQLTRLAVPALLSGLVPIAFSANGERLLAEYEGEDTSEAWTVEVGARRARRVRGSGTRSLQGDGISQDGTTLLLAEGSFEEPPSDGRIVTMPFDGGAPSVLVAHGAAGSWNG